MQSYHFKAIFPQDIKKNNYIWLVAGCGVGRIIHFDSWFQPAFCELVLITTWRIVDFPLYASQYVYNLCIGVIKEKNFMYLFTDFKFV